MNAKFWRWAAVGVLITGASEPLSAAPLSGCDEAAFRAALAAGGEVTFTGNCTYSLLDTIVISNHAVLNGSGHNIRVSGQDIVRLFSVQPGISFSVQHVTLMNGRSTEGGAILNDGGTVSLVDCVLANNAVADGAAQGGAILNRTGSVTAVSCLFSNNQALGSKGGQITFGGGCGGPASGGAIANDRGQVRLTNCQFAVNSALGGNGGDYPMAGGGCGAPGAGGGIYSSGGSLESEGVNFSYNLANGGSAGSGIFTSSGGKGSGGAVTVKGGTFLFVRSQFLRNSTQGGGAGRDGIGGMAAGGALDLETAVGTITECLLNLNGARAGDGRSGVLSAEGRGGAIFNSATTTVGRSSFSANTVTGATAGGRPGAAPGGIGSGGGLHNEGLIQISESTFADNVATGGYGNCKESIAPPTPTPAPGGDGLGGALRNLNKAYVANTTFSGNTAKGGPGVTCNPVMPAVGSPGSAFGGAILNAATAVVCQVTFYRNSAQAPIGAGGAIHSTGLTLVTNTILAGSLSGGDCGGLITDGGHNLASDASCILTGTGSLNSTDPKVGPLADNGGPTLTHALLQGSPAIDAGGNADCFPTDQRGKPRPMFNGCDIGAYELQDVRLLSLQRLSPQRWRLTGMSEPNAPFHVESSPTLPGWTTSITGTVQRSGLIQVEWNGSAQQQFFRIGSP